MGNIILIGFMGCGKSSVGRELSSEYGYCFLDTDEWIENDQRASINSIFESMGEEYFRKCETICIETILALNVTNEVISVGGGLPMKSENQEILKKIGKIVYLRASEDTLVSRLTGDTTRPLLRNDKYKDIRDRIIELFEKRVDTYEKIADIIIDTDYKSLQNICKEIKEAIQ